MTFSRDNGHPHPHLQLAVNNYAVLLREVGRSEEEIQAALKALAQPFGMDLG